MSKTDKATGGKLRFRHGGSRLENYVNRSFGYI